MDPRLAMLLRASGQDMSAACAMPAPHAVRFYRAGNVPKWATSLHEYDFSPEDAALVLRIEY